MPSDDTPDFRAAQSKHAEEIKTARTITRLTGLSMNQVRQSLRAQGKAASRAETGTVPISQQKPVDATPYPARPPTSSKFEPTPFTLALPSISESRASDLSDGYQTINAVFAGVKGTIKLRGQAFDPS